jgi:nucleoredoxin
MAQAKPLPLTAKDVALMLRSGYSVSTVTQELSRRHFVDNIDEAKEKLLTQVGATADLVSALKAGTYAVPVEDIARAKAELAAEAERKTIAAAEARQFNTLYQAQLAKERADAQFTTGRADAMARLLKGCLVRSHNGGLVPADDESFAKKKLIAFYFSAHWCGPCRKFTPQLVEYYNRVVAQHPEFEIVFYSFDKTPDAMEGYMRDMQMPWPAIDYQKLTEKQVVTQKAGDAIPSLVLVDATGKVLSTAYVDGKRIGPANVLADLDAIFAGGRVAEAH